MRGDTLLLCELSRKCFGESEEGGRSVPLGHNGEKVIVRRNRETIHYNMKHSSTYFPESLPEGCVEGTLGALCNGNVKTDDENVEGKTFCH